jgi:hypothetical protein
MLTLFSAGLAKANKVWWWWENPSPNFDKNVSWRRRVIKSDGKAQHHDQVFGDLKGTGKAQLAYWNQQAKTLFSRGYPQDPRRAEPWPAHVISAASPAKALPTRAIRGGCGGRGHRRRWQSRPHGGQSLVQTYRWKRVQGCEGRKRLAGESPAGKFKPGRFLQIVIAPGDGVGPLKWYECKGEPTNAADWVGHDLAGRDLVHVTRWRSEILMATAT